MRRKENDVLVQVWKWVLEFIKYYFTFDEIIAIIIYLLVTSLKSISVISGGPLSFIIVKLFCIQLYREEFIELHFRLVWIILNVEQRKKNVKKEFTKSLN